jgi:hypothetical protein
VAEDRWHWPVAGRVHDWLLGGAPFPRLLFLNAFLIGLWLARRSQGYEMAAALVGYVSSSLVVEPIFALIVLSLRHGLEHGVGRTVALVVVIDLVCISSSFLAALIVRRWRVARGRA